MVYGLASNDNKMSNLVLYRKYRPQKFSDVISQEHVKTTLANAVINNRAGHAYLFTGPRGVGKTTIARIFARAINCPNQKNGEPCNECDICKSFLAGTSLDIMEIDAASHTGVDNIREIIDHLKFAPTTAKFKVVIVDEVHMLSKGAFNALLKTLEEPPAHVVFILATTEVHKVPATIVSRTQRFDFKRVGLADLIKLIKYVLDSTNSKATEEAIVMIAQAADGSFRDSLSLLDQVISFSDGNITEQLVSDVLGLISIKTTADFLKLLVGGETKQALDFVSKIVFEGVDLYQFQKDFLEYLRKILLMKLGNVEDSEVTQETKVALRQNADLLELPKLIQIIEVFQKVGNDMKFSPIQSLPLELAVVELTQEPDQVSSPSLRAGGEAISAHRGKANSKEEIATSQRVATRDDEEANPDELETIKQYWPQILEKVKEYNHSLISSLKLAQPVKLNGKELILLFPYKFHKDAIEARKNRIVIDQVIEDISGLKIMVKPILEKDWNESGNNNESIVESALKIMGGEVE